MDKIAKKFVLVLIIFCGLLLVGVGVFYFLTPKLSKEAKLVKISEAEGKSKFTFYGEITAFQPPYDLILISVENASSTVEITPGQDKLVYLSQPKVLDASGKAILKTDLKKGQKANFFGSIIEDNLIAEQIVLR